MGSLLSTVSKTYLEPEHGIEMANTGKIYDQYKDSVVKFQSLSLMKPILLNGPKVFLYRPLAQHLHKISNVQSYWLTFRAEYLRTNYKEYDVWTPTSDIEMIAYHWIRSVHEMSQHTNVLWIESNNLFMQPKMTMDSVCDHFNFPKISDFSLSQVDVKKMMINGRSSACEINIAEATRVSVDHGVIHTNEASTEIFSLCNMIGETYKVSNSLLYGNNEY